MRVHMVDLLYDVHVLLSSELRTEHLHRHLDSVQLHESLLSLVLWF